MPIFLCNSSRPTACLHACNTRSTCVVTGGVTPSDFLNSTLKNPPVSSNESASSGYACRAFFREKLGIGCHFDLILIPLQAFIADLHTAYIAIVFNTNNHPAAVSIGHGNKRDNHLFAERFLMLNLLRYHKSTISSGHPWPVRTQPLDFIHEKSLTPQG